MNPNATASLLTDALVAATGVVLLYYAWRGVGHLPILARLMTGLTLAVTVLGSFGFLLLTFGAGGHAFVREPRMPWSGQAVAAPVPASPTPAAGPASDTSSSPSSPRAARVEPPAAASVASVDAERPAAVAPEPAVSPKPPSETSQPAGRPTETAREAAIAPTPPPARAAAPAPGKPSAARAGRDRRMTVLFATDRAQDEDDGHHLGAARGGRLVLGRAVVDAHAASAATARDRDTAGRGNAVAEVDVVERPRWAEIASGELTHAGQESARALVFVHGYNTSLEAAVERAARIARQIDFDGLVLVYSWPSQGLIPSYSYDQASARQSEPFLREFLADVVAGCGIGSVSLLGEGIGAGPMLAALADLGASPPAGLRIDQVMLAAPDLDARRLRQLAEKIGNGVRGVTLYAAAETRALAVSRRFHGGLPRAGEIAGGEPVVLPGIDTIAVPAEEGDTSGATGHDLQPAAIAGDIAALLHSPAPPPDRRGALQRVAARGGGHYWRIAR